MIDKNYSLDKQSITQSKRALRLEIGRSIQESEGFTSYSSADPGLE
jgi:hypothetical protein